MAKDSAKVSKKKSYVGGYELRLIDGYSFDEVASALQKSIRRNKEYDACYWMYVMHASGYYKYCWKRLMIIASEDIGNGTPLAPVIVNSLWQNYSFCIDSKKRNSLDAILFLFQATMYLCGSDKLREADTLANVLTKEYKSGKRLDIPEYAIDPHTHRGKELHGRWYSGTPEENAQRNRKWFDVWSYATPKSKKKDKYIERMKKLEGVTS